MSEGDREMFKLPVVGEMSSSGGISTTLSPTKRKKRRKKVKVTKKNKTTNIENITDKVIIIPTLGKVSVLETHDIEESVKKVDQGHIASHYGNQFSESSSNKFNFVLPNLGDVILTNLNQVDINSEIGGNNGLKELIVSSEELEKTNDEGSQSTF